jgi:molecular chaperone HscB
LVKELEQHKAELEGKFSALTEELKKYWSQWDAAEDSADDAQKIIARGKMVDLLNRRSYIRNLVRDVNEALAD